MGESVAGRRPSQRGQRDSAGFRFRARCYVLPQLLVREQPRRTVRSAPVAGQRTSRRVDLRGCDRDRLSRDSARALVGSDLPLPGCVGAALHRATPCGLPRRGERSQILLQLRGAGPGGDPGRRSARGWGHAQWPTPASFGSRTLGVDWPVAWHSFGLMDVSFRELSMPRRRRTAGRRED